METTEQKPAVKPDETPVDREENQFMDDWEGTRETKQPAAKETKPIAENTASTTVTEEKAPQIAKSKLPPDMSSEILIGAVDTTQSLIFGSLLKRKIRNRFTNVEIEKCKRYNQQVEDKEIKKKDLSDEDFEMLYAYNALQEVSADIPFTDEEYKKMQKPLSQLIVLNGYDIPPGIALSIAVAQIMAPRICDAFFE